MIDPSDATQVGIALEAWCRERMPEAAVARLPAPLGRGFDTFIYTFALGGAVDPARRGDLVLRLYGAPEHAAKAHHEAAAQRFVAGAGYPGIAPLVVEDQAPGFGLPLMIMPFVAGGTMLQRIASNPLRTPALLSHMAALHAQLHRLPIDGCPLSPDEPHSVRQMRALRERAAPVSETTGVASALRWLDDHTPMALPEERSFTHNDFHPLNILADGDGRWFVIDWSDATVGDRGCDVARTATLLSFAYIAASSTLERVVLRAARGYLRSRYLNAYQRAHPLDARRFAWWKAQQAVTGWVQVLELEHNRASGATVTAAAAAIPTSVLGEAFAYAQARMREAEQQG